MVLADAEPGLADERGVGLHGLAAVVRVDVGTRGLLGRRRTVEGERRGFLLFLALLALGRFLLGLLQLLLGVLGRVVGVLVGADQVQPGDARLVDAAHLVEAVADEVVDAVDPPVVREAADQAR